MPVGFPEGTPGLRLQRLGPPTPDRGRTLASGLRLEWSQRYRHGEGQALGGTPCYDRFWFTSLCRTPIDLWNIPILPQCVQTRSD